MAIQEIASFSAGFRAGFIGKKTTKKKRKKKKKKKYSFLKEEEL